MGQSFEDENPNRQITADGESNDGGMSRSWVDTTWPLTQKTLYRRQVVFGCRPIETVGAPYAVVSEYQQIKAGVIGHKGLSAVIDRRF